MQRFAWKSIAIAFIAWSMACGLTACANDGVGDPCIPESIPCEGKDCGFSRSESYVESSSVQCRTRVCIVNKLEGGSKLADPRDIVGVNEGVKGRPADGPAAVSNEQLDQSVYCTCRCKDAKGKKVEDCNCGDFPGFRCEEVLTLGGDGIKGSYCVKPEKT